MNRIARTAAALAFAALATTQAIAPAAVQAQTAPQKAVVTAASPDGSLVLTVTTDGSDRPVYSLSRKGKLLIGASKLGFTLTDGLNMVRGFRITGSETTNADTTWEQPWGERQFVHDRHNEVLIHLEQNADYAGRKMNVRFRLFDNGFGFRLRDLLRQRGRRCQRQDGCSEKER